MTKDVERRLASLAAKRDQETEGSPEWCGYQGEIDGIEWTQKDPNSQEVLRPWVWCRVTTDRLEYFQEGDRVLVRCAFGMSGFYLVGFLSETHGPLVTRVHSWSVLMDVSPDRFGDSDLSVLALKEEAAIASGAVNQYSEGADS